MSIAIASMDRELTQPSSPPASAVAAFTERFNGALNHCREVAAETVGHGGCTETVAIIKSAACGCESGQYIVLDTGAGSLPVSNPLLPL